MTYRTVYDITQTFDPTWFCAGIFVFIFTAIFVALISQIKILRGAPRREFWGIFGIICGLAFLCSCSFVFRSFQQQEHAKTLLTTGEALVVEGMVADFNGISKVESFNVNSVHFQYSEANLSYTGYKYQSRGDGPIKNGVYVRIHYYYEESLDQNIILKLEIGE